MLQAWKAIKHALRVSCTSGSTLSSHEACMILLRLSYRNHNMNHNMKIIRTVKNRLYLAILRIIVKQSYLRISGIVSILYECSWIRLW